jgi:CspA family cold shock protein
MPTGTVKFYNDQKGYGFIAGQKVSFETEVDRRSGKTAVSTIRPA